jgi:hypothetical protein
LVPGRRTARHLVGVRVPTYRLIVIDPDDGTRQDLEESTDSFLTWQRLAP